MSIRQQWKTLEAKGDWTRAAAAKKVDAVFASLPEVPELRALYALANGGSLGKIDVFDLEELSDVNHRQSYRKTFPSAVFFASDGGSKFFFVDATGALGRGVGAVIMMGRGSARWQDCVAAADDLDGFVELAARGETPWRKGLPLEVTEIDDLLELVTESGGKVVGRPYDVQSNARTRVVERCRVQLPRALHELLQEVDGMRIDAARVTIWPFERINPVDGLSADLPQFPALLWFAEDDDGNRYAVTPSPWRGLEADAVVRVAPQADPADAPFVGRLTPIISGWAKT